jgi:hypothetical protein
VDARIGVGGYPLFTSEIVVENAVLRGTMGKLADKADAQLITAIARNGKSQGIDSSFLWKTRAGGSVAQIAVVKFVGAGLDAFVAGSATLAGPSGAQGQARRMRPRTTFQLAGRHEKGASQRKLLLSGSPQL